MASLTKHATWLLNFIFKNFASILIISISLSFYNLISQTKFLDTSNLFYAFAFHPFIIHPAIY